MIFIIPLNRDTENIYYGQRFILDGKVKTEPRAWRVTKVNRIGTPGIGKFTLAQTEFNADTDAIELDDDGNVVAWWADINKNIVTPKDREVVAEATISKYHSSITFSGLKPEIKVGGNYKKFAVHFFEDEDEIEYRASTWSIAFADSAESANALFDIKDSTTSSDLGDGQIKIKFKGDNTYIGRQFVITNTSSDNIVSKIEVGIVGL